jgi:hypothetical protein
MLGQASNDVEDRRRPVKRINPSESLPFGGFDDRGDRVAFLELEFVSAAVMTLSICP